MSKKKTKPTPVFCTDGRLGSIIDDEHTATDGSQQALIELTDGTQVLIPTNVLSKRTDGSYALPFSRQAIQQDYRTPDGTRIVIPIVAEELSVGKRVIETGRVRVHKNVHEHTEQIDEPLFREHVHVERVAVDKVLEQPVGVHYEGDVMVIPVIEEVLVVEKRLIHRENVRISKLRTATTESQNVTLRREELTVERLDSQADGHE
jgi:uncharacterized protein (TIGR02271 family)